MNNTGQHTGQHTGHHTAQKYDRISAILHWTIGIGILALAGTELVRHEFPRGHFVREGLKAIHQPAGTLLLALILVRITWRILGARVPAATEAGPAAFAAKFVHAALYALMVAVPLTGLLHILGSGKSIDFGFFALSFPLKEAIGVYAKSLREMHEVLALGILGLAGVHALAALGHHYLLKDQIMSRMGLRRERQFDAVPAQ